MKVVYVAGPFRAKTNWLVKQHVREAEKVALDVWRLGAAAICPHKNSEEFDKELPDDLMLDGTMAILKRCDAIMLVPGWHQSAGTRQEIAWCKTHSRPVFETIAELRTWLEYVHLSEHATG